jgi:hypothetical protein
LMFAKPFGFVQVRSRCSLIEVSDVIVHSPGVFCARETEIGGGNGNVYGAYGSSAS